MTRALSEELRRAFDARALSLQSYVSDLTGELAGSRPGFSRALELLEEFPRAAIEVLRSEWNANPDPAARVVLARQYLQHLNSVASLTEDWFSRGTDISLPSSLWKAVERECEELFGKRNAVLAIGSADNFETFVANLKDQLFAPLGPRCPTLPSEFDKYEFALMRIPRIEGLQPLWRPVVLGHELAHIAIAEKGTLARLDLHSKFDWAHAGSLQAPTFVTPGLPPALAIYRVAELWAEELLCDAYAVRRYGPAGVAALTNFLEVIGATEGVGTHPPGWTRARLQLKWLGAPVPSDLKTLLRPWVDLAVTPPPVVPNWADYLMTFFESIASDFPVALSDWPETYSAKKRSKYISYVADRLRRGIPASETYGTDGSMVPVEDADILNAGWIGWTKEYKTPIQKLVAKSLESRELLRLWAESGGGSAELAKPAPLPSVETRTRGAVLSQVEVVRRLRSTEDDAIVVTPLLPEWSAGAAVDVRLGNKFIVFRRSRTESFDPLDVQQDPRSMQALDEREWGDSFILHPGELVLASTLEFLVLPADIAGQVVTRSSYGRLGLITATAVLAHPHFHGCLTLELVNLGVVPIELTPGERIAQVIFQRVAPAAPMPDFQKYTYPTGPEFSKVRSDRDAVTLRGIKSKRKGTP